MDWQLFASYFTVKSTDIFLQRNHLRLIHQRGELNFFNVTLIRIHVK